MSCLGVIPAAGTGSRWGGHYKELLPCGEGQILLTRTVEAMRRGGATAILVVSRSEKLAAHAAHLCDVSLPVYYAVQGGDNDIWSAIEESFGFPAERYLFAMPDTYIPLSAFEVAEGLEFGMGLFETEQPERFGVLREGRIWNKSTRLSGFWKAWGVLTWTPAVVKAWKQGRPRDYTQAINLALERYSTQMWVLDYYHDMASFADYRRWLREEKAVPA